MCIESNDASFIYLKRSYDHFYTIHLLFTVQDMCILCPWDILLGEEGGRFNGAPQKHGWDTFMRGAWAELYLRHT